MAHTVTVSLSVKVVELDPPVQHDIQVELEFDTGPRGGIVVQGTLPKENTEGLEPVFLIGRGRNLLGTIIDWLQQMDHSVRYLPAYKAEECRRLIEKDRQRLEKLGIPSV